MQAGAASVSGHIDDCLPLYKAIVDNNREGAASFLQTHPEALDQSLTDRQEKALHVAIHDNRRPTSVLAWLLHRVSDEGLASRHRDGNTALLVAAIMGNTKAAVLLLRRSEELLWEENNGGCVAMVEAARYGHKSTVRYLLVRSLRDQRQRLSSEICVSLIELLLIAGFYDVALYVIEKSSHLLNPQNCESLLAIVAEKPAQYGLWLFPINLLRVQIIMSLCNKILESGDFSRFKAPFLMAAKLGVHEIVEEILTAQPEAIWFTNDKGHNAFHLSAMHRHENIFALLCEKGRCKNIAIGSRDTSNRNILHLVSASDSSHEFTYSSGPAIRMQYELQWFEEVKKHVPPSYIKETDYQGRTAEQIFIETHRDLVKSGEKWMKGAAAAGIVGATLIATVAFAAAITVPGGTKDGVGVPNYIANQDDNTLFRVFLYAVGFALFFSISSVLMFLSILASGYIQSDFRTLLANRLIFGLLTLLGLLAAILTAFWIALNLAMRQEVKMNLGSYMFLLPLCVPLLLFLYLFRPLVAQMMWLPWGLKDFFRESPILTIPFIDTPMSFMSSFSRLTFNRWVMMWILLGPSVFQPKQLGVLYRCCCRNFLLRFENWRMKMVELEYNSAVSGYQWPWRYMHWQ